jgi:hypothetical protein
MLAQGPWTLRGSIHTQWLLLQDQEHSVNQFEVFREVIKLICVSNCTLASSTLCSTYVVEDNQLWCPTSLTFTDGVEKTMIVKRRNQLLNEEG